MNLIVGITGHGGTGKGIRENREPKAALLSAAAKEDQRIQLSNVEREVKNAQANVVLANADIIGTRNRIAELQTELDDAKTALSRREKRHKDAQQKWEKLQSRFEYMKKAVQA